MFFEHRVFWLPKDIRQQEEYQDAYSVDTFRGRASIADGVSSSLFSASWAKILAQAVVVDPPDLSDAPLLVDWLARQREQWIAPIDVESLAWHQKPKFQEGSHSTLLWIELFAADEAEAGVAGAMRLYGYAVGDSCLFHVRDGKMLRSFPLQDSRSFNDDPPVVGSVDKQKDHLVEFQTLDSFCQDSDLLVLCTDAVAAWALSRIEAGTPPRWIDYWDVTQDDWRQEVIELREKQEMRYDDTTMLLLRIGKKSKKKGRLDLEPV